MHSYHKNVQRKPLVEKPSLNMLFRMFLSKLDGNNKKDER